MPKFWLAHQKDFVRDNAHQISDKQIAVILTGIVGRIVTRLAVREIRRKFGIKKRMGRGLCQVLPPSVPETNCIPDAGSAIDRPLVGSLDTSDSIEKESKHNHFLPDGFFD